jgi:hypothetical protein
MVKRKNNTTTPADDFTPPGVQAGPFDIPEEWLAGRTPAQWAADREAEEAELKRQRAIIDRANNAEAIRHAAQLKELRAIREAVASPALPSAPVKAQRDKPKSRRIQQVLQKLYPPDGKAPAGLSVKVIVAAVWDEFRERHWKAPDRKTIMRVVDEIGRK